MIGDGMIGDKRYDRGLKTLPKCCRDDLDNYFRWYQPSDNNDVMMLLAGQQLFQPSPFMDDIMKVHLFLWRCVPSGSWGSPELVARWLAKGIVRDAVLATTIITLHGDLPIN